MTNIVAHSEIMTPESPRWLEFIEKLHESIQLCGCGGDRVKPTHPIARRILKLMKCTEVNASLEYFKAHGGYCDCEILLNVDLDWSWMTDGSLASTPRTACGGYMSRWYRHRCDYCDKSLRKVDMAPMLHDDVWTSIAPELATLCGPCMFKSAHHKGIKLTLADLRPCMFNLYPRIKPVGLYRRSWFDLFRAMLKADPPNLAEWQQVAELMGAR